MPCYAPLIISSEKELFVPPMSSLIVCPTVGDTDGLIKGKRYFTCPSKHGKVVRITNVVAVLPNKVRILLHVTSDISTV